jgi:hypothetical protein
VQGDTLYASAANTLTALTKDTNATRYLSNTGASNNPAWAQVGLTDGVMGTLPVANGGTNASAAGITAFNNITGFTAAGASGTTSTNLVFSTSPTLVTPVLGAATATSINGLTITSSTGTLTITNGKTASFSNSITFAGTDSTTMTFPPASAAVGYLNIPQNSQSADYTAVLADAGKHLYHPTSDDNPRTFTIPANASVAYEIGTAITFVNDQNTLSIAITSDTLVWSEDGSTGTRTLAENGMATAIKVTSTRWLISGTGLS